MGKHTRLSRRAFFKSSGMVVAGAVLASCGGPAESPAPSQAQGNAAPAAGEATAPAAPGDAGMPTAAPAEAAAPTADTITAPSRVEGKVVIWSPGDNGSVSDWSQDPILQEVEKATGVQIAMFKLGWEHYDDRINAAVASGQMPDIIGTVNHSNHHLIEQWVRDGVVAPFDGELANALPDVLGEYQGNQTLNELKIDGKVYMDPVEWGTGNEPNMGLIHIRKDLLDKYGMQPPDTFEQYFDFLRAAVKDGQTGVFFGAQDGIGAAVNAFVGAHGVPMLGWVKKGDTWEHWSIQDGTKQGLLLFQRMAAEGLVDPASWETTGDARDKYVAGQGASLLFNGGGHIGRIQNDMDLAGKGAKNWLLPALDAGAGARGYTSEPMFYGVTFIGSLQGNNPQGAAKVLDYLQSEEGIKLTVLGIPGRDYEEVNGEIKLKPEQRAKDNFPTEGGDTGAHPLATTVVSWIPLKWQNWQLLYGKDQAYKEWYDAMRKNQTQYQIKSFGLLTTTPEWTDFQVTGGELLNRAFLEIVKATDANQAAARFDQYVQDWKSAGGDQAAATMSDVLNKLYAG